MKLYHYYTERMCVALQGLVEREYHALKPTVRKDGRHTYELWSKWHREAKRLGGITRPGGNGRPSLIEFDYIPFQYREEIRNLYGEPKKQAGAQSLLERIEPDEAAARFYSTHEVTPGVNLPKEHQKKYTANACLLNTIKQMYMRTASVRNALGTGMRGFWPKVAKDILELKKDYPHTLPKNHQALQRKYKEYCQVGYESLISGKFCNENSSKITDDIEAWIIREMASTRQSIDMVYMRYPAEAERQGWPTDITAYAFRHRASQQRIKQLIEFKRFGRKGFRKKYGHTFKLKRAEFSNDIWVSDGSGLNWYYRNEHGKPEMATTYVVMDARSWKFLGWSTKAGLQKENFEMQLEAYRMALRNSGAKPYQLLFDNQGGHKKQESREFYSKLAQVAFPTRAYRPSGKPVEQGFKRFQTLKLSEFPFWSGFGRDTHSNQSYKPDMEGIKANIHKLPSFEEVVQLLDVIISEWNELATNGIEAPNKLYDEYRNADEQPVSLEEMAELFWNMGSGRDGVIYRAAGLKVTINREVKWFEVYTDDGDVDFNFRRKFLNQRFWYRYDPDQEIEDVDLFQKHPTGGFQRVATASPKREVNRSVKYLDTGEREWIDDTMNDETVMMDQMDAELEAIGYSEDVKWTAWKDRIQTQEPVLVDDDEEDDPSVANRM